MEQKRKIGLDILRALAILIVVHVHGVAIYNDTEVKQYWIPLPDGVSLFFVLSGFLIGSILFQDFVLSKPNLKTLINFYKRRWLRTVPNYYLFIGINFVLAYSHLVNEGYGYTWKFIFFLQSFYHGFSGPFWESWSLCVEEWFYILFPLLLGMILFILPRKTTFLISTLLFIAFSITLRILRQHWQAPLDSYWFQVEIVKTAVCRFDSIGWGILAAFFVAVTKQNKKLNLALFWFAIVTMFIRPFVWKVPDTPIWNSLTYTIEPFLVSFAFPYLSSINLPQNKFTKTITWISRISYSLYLVHLGIVLHLIEAHLKVKGMTEAHLLQAGYWIITFLISHLIYTYFEKPIMLLRDKKITFSQILSLKTRPKTNG